MRRASWSPSLVLFIPVTLGFTACGGNSPTATVALTVRPSTAASVAPASTSAAAPPTPRGYPSASTATPPSTGTPAAPPKITGNLTIFAASSLTDAYNEMKGLIEAANPGTVITYNFAASSALRTQLEQGAKADLYASADTVQMDTAKKSGVIQGESTLFVRNTPVIIVPANNPKGIAAPADLAKPGVKIVLAAPEVPIGNYARQVIKKVGTDPANGADYEAKALANLVSNEANVRAVVSKIQLGEGDAGIVYSSDVTPAVRAQVKIIAIPTGVNIIAEYPVAIIKGAGNTAGAQAFIDYLVSAAGQAILLKWGFVPVSASGAPVNTVAISAFVTTARSFTIADLCTIPSVTIKARGHAVGAV